MSKLGVGDLTIQTQGLGALGVGNPVDVKAMYDTTNGNPSWVDDIEARLRGHMPGPWTGISTCWECGLSHEFIVHAPKDIEKLINAYRVMYDCLRRKCSCIGTFVCDPCLTRAEVDKL